MLNIIAFLLNLIDQHIIWLYVVLLFLLLFYLRGYSTAHRERINTVFSIEKEVAAHREGRAMSAIGVILGVAAVVTALKFYVVPTVDVAQLAEPTPTVTLHLQVPTRAPQPTDTPTPTAEAETPTPRPRPTQPPVLSLPTASPAPTAQVVAPASCPDPNVRITSPGMGAVVSGGVSVQGTANHAQFQFYKLEFGQGEEPSSWHVVHDVHRAPVLGGRLETFDSGAVPNGVYWLKLTVVDTTGNFPPPCLVRIIVQN